MATDDRTGSLGFEDKLWNAADLLRNNMDPAEYKPRRCRRTPIRSEQGLLHNPPVPCRRTGARTSPAGQHRGGWTLVTMAQRRGRENVSCRSAKGPGDMATNAVIQYALSKKRGSQND